MNKNSWIRICHAAVLTAALIGNSSADVVQLSSQKAMQLAQQQSLAARASALSVESQQKTVQGTLASFLPVVNGSGTYSHFFAQPSFFDEPAGGSGPMPDTGLAALLASMFSNLGSSFTPPDNFFSLGFSIGQPLFTGGKLANGYKLAKTTTKAQEATHERTLTDIGFSAQQMYWAYVGMLKGLESIREGRAWLEDLAAMQQKLFNNEMIIELDLLNTRIQIDNFKLTELKTQNAIANFGDQLLLFLGLPTGATIEVDTSELVAELEAFAAPTPEQVDLRLDERQDLKALRYQIESLKTFKRIQVGSYFPNLSGFFSNSYSNQYNEDKFQRTTSAGLQLNWTIFDWGKAAREAQKTDLQVQTLEMTYRNSAEQIRLKINALVRSVEESREALAIAQEDMETARKALHVAKVKYDAQAITNTDLLNSRTQLTNKSVAYLQARINAILALQEYKIAPMGAAATVQAGGVSK